MTELVLENRAAAIRDSELPYPENALWRAKYVFWRAIYPVYPNIRDTLLALGLIKHEGRQFDRLGRIAPNKELGDFLAHLGCLGFGNHFIAWVDEGELIGLRRLEGFRYQYHLRIFKDGEVRGHYEFTPECHPIRHLKERGMEPRREEFLDFLGDWIVPSDK